MSKPETSIYGLRPHHIAMAVIAVIVAVALLANFYLW
jgi:hypothetical protein